MILSANKDIRSISDIHIYYIYNIYIYIYIYIYICVCVWVCVFIYVYITPPEHLCMFLHHLWPLSSSIAGLFCLQWHWCHCGQRGGQSGPATRSFLSFFHRWWYFGGCLCVAEGTLTLQFLQLFHIIIVTLMFLMNVKDPLVLGLQYWW